MEGVGGCGERCGEWVQPPPPLQEVERVGDPPLSASLEVGGELKRGCDLISIVTLDRLEEEEETPGIWFDMCMVREEGVSIFWAFTVFVLSFCVMLMLCVTVGVLVVLSIG
jgi:hypothetical protein